jgi:hypothetical protein
MKLILKLGGTLFIVDNDLRSGTFGRWVREAYGEARFNPDRVETFWRDSGFSIDRLSSCWRFDNRDDLERVLHLEFPEEHANRFIGCHSGLEIDYDLLLIHRTFDS